VDARIADLRRTQSVGARTSGRTYAGGRHGIVLCDFIDEVGSRFEQLTTCRGAGFGGDADGSRSRGSNKTHSTKNARDCEEEDEPHGLTRGRRGRMGS
jgi:hypothetical protein